MRPGPATSAKAPRACALKALKMYEKVLGKEVTKNGTSTFTKLEETLTKGEDEPAWAKYEAKQQ